MAARGLDVDDLTHVINYGLPEDVAVYTHRSGRTGRANKSGVSVAIIHSRELSRLRQIQKVIGKTFEYKKVPTPEHIIEKQLYNLADRLERVEVNDAEMSRYLPGVRKKLEWLSEEDLLKRVLSLEFNRLLNYYQRMPDIDLNAPEKKERGAKGERSEKRAQQDKDRRTAEEGYERLMINTGKARGFYPGNLMELINKSVPGRKPDIGRIDLFPDYTLFDVRKEDARRILDALKHAEFFGDKLHAEVASDRNYAGTEADKPARGKRTARAKESTAGKKSAKAKTGKNDKKSDKKSNKPKYNGNYDIFIKKK